MCSVDAASHVVLNNFTLVITRTVDKWKVDQKMFMNYMILWNDREKGLENTHISNTLTKFDEIHSNIP